MKFLVTHPDGTHHVLQSEAPHADGAAMMHWGEETAKRVFEKCGVLIESVVDTVRHGAHYVECGGQEQLGATEHDDGEPVDTFPPDPPHATDSGDAANSQLAPPPVAPANVVSLHGTTVPAPAQGGSDESPTETPAA